jgi:hypothetical protein
VAIVEHEQVVGGTLRRGIPWTVAALGVVLLVAMVPAGSRASGGGDAPIFTDGLASGWSNWSWSTAVGFGATSPVHAGTTSMSVTFSDAWGGLYLHVEPSLAGSGFRSLRFWIRGGAAGGQKLRVLLADGGGSFGAASPLTAPADQWTEVDIPVSTLGSPATISGVVWQDTTGGAQPAFWLDDVRLVAWEVPPTPAPTPPPSVGPPIAIDAGADVHPISDAIYGMNYASEALAAELRLPVRRWGGNSTSRYNWQADETNTGSDWYFENVPTDSGAADAFVDQDRRTGTKTLMTVPLIGRVAKRRLDNHPYDCGFKVSKYGAQQATDPWDADCGNGVRAGGGEITGNDPNDTSVVITPAFVQDWVQHFVARYGPASAGGVAYYNLDNEPMLWPDTHRDVHPQPTSYDELRDRTWEYAAAVKAGDPSARTLGPAEWGWTGYFWSALDWAGGGDWWNHPADRLAHGNVPFVEWYLQQMAAYEQQHGTRILDLLDEHFYPPDVALVGAGDAARQERRLRSTRLLWDRTYSEETWIAEPVYLIPRLRDWIAANYPGTGTAITEYNWGALDDINGALAQADVLGILGREGLDLATLWGPPEPGQPGAFAFRMYRNLDGAGRGFGETSVRATSGDQGRLAAYAARRAADGALTVVVINKTGGALTSTVSLAGFAAAGSAQVWRYSADDLTAIARGADLPVTGSSLSATFPPVSITLLVLDTGGPSPTPTPTTPPRRVRRSLYSGR